MKIKRIAIVTLLTLFACQTYADLIQMGARGRGTETDETQYERNEHGRNDTYGADSYWLEGENDAAEGMLSVDTHWRPHSIGSCVVNNIENNVSQVNQSWTIPQSDACVCGSSGCGQNSNNLDSHNLGALCRVIAKAPNTNQANCDQLSSKSFSNPGEYAQFVSAIQQSFEQAIREFDTAYNSTTYATALSNFKQSNVSPASFYKRVETQIVNPIMAEETPEGVQPALCSTLSTRDAVEEDTNCKCSENSIPITVTSGTTYDQEQMCPVAPTPGPAGPGNVQCDQSLKITSAESLIQAIEQGESFSSLKLTQANLENYQSASSLSGEIPWEGVLKDIDSELVTLQEKFEGAGGDGGGNGGDPFGDSVYASSPSGGSSNYETSNSNAYLKRCEKNSKSKWSITTAESYQQVKPFFGPAYKLAVKEGVGEYINAVTNSLGSNTKYLPALLKIAKQGTENDYNLAGLNCPPAQQGGAPQTPTGLTGAAKTLIENAVSAHKNGLKTSMMKVVYKRRLIPKCEALAMMTTYTDFSDGYEEEAIKNESHDGKIKCKSFGNDTQDYPKCKEAINYYDAATVAKVAMHEVQNVNMQGRNMERMAELNAPVEGAGPGGGPGINHAGMLEAQKGGISDMRKAANQRAAFDGVKAVKFAEIAISMPNGKKLMDRCNPDTNVSKMTQNNNLHAHGGYLTIKKFLDEKMKLSNIDPSLLDLTQVNDDRISDERTVAILTQEGTDAKYYNDYGGACGVALREENVLLLNSSAQEAAKEIAAQAAVAAGVNAAKADILKKQIKTLNGIITAVDEYAPEGAPGLQTDEFMIEECQFNPAAEGCQGATPEFARAVGFNGGSLNVATNGGNMATGQINPNGDGNGTNNSATGNSRPSGSKFNSGLGGFVDGVDKGPGGKANTVAAARAKAGGSNNIGNAGLSGGGAGGARAATGGGSRGGGGKGGGARAAAYGGKYKQGGGSGIAGFYSGAGRGARGRKPASGGGNPFSKLFGKKGANKNGSLSFRGPAGIGGKKGSIFDRISSRYKVVNSKDRLLEYK